MECQVCQVRSAIGRCEETNKLVCEECSLGCYRCGKRIAVTAGHQTKSGHLYCSPCYKERAERRAGRSRQAEGEGQGLINDEAPIRRPGMPAQGEQDEAADEAVLAQWEPPAPWKMSLYLALAAILLSLFFMFFPGYRTIPLGAGFPIRYIPLGLLALFLATIGTVWAVIGIVGPRFIEQRNLSIFGVVLALVAGVMAISVTKPPPMSDIDNAIAGSSSSRQFQSETEREQYRTRFLTGQTKQP